MMNSEYTQRWKTFSTGCTLLHLNNIHTNLPKIKPSKWQEQERELTDGFPSTLLFLHFLLTILKKKKKKRSVCKGLYAFLLCQQNQPKRQFSMKESGQNSITPIMVLILYGEAAGSHDLMWYACDCFLLFEVIF